MSKLDLLPPGMRLTIGRFLSRSIVFFHAARWMISPPTTAQNIVASMLVPAEYDLGYLTGELFDLSMSLIEHARTDDLAHLAGRVTESQFEQIDRFPGEHYRLLQAAMRTFKPSLVVEIGTYTGLSALVISQALDASSRLITYDVVPWEQFPATVLDSSDFSQSFQQRIGDLADADYFNSQREVMMCADLLFIDGPKNGTFEPSFLARFASVRTRPCILIFDDIRMLHMIELWRSLRLNKIDLTSFGHWTGTGLVYYEP